MKTVPIEPEPTGAPGAHSRKNVWVDFACKSGHGGMFGEGTAPRPADQLWCTRCDAPTLAAGVRRSAADRHLGRRVRGFEGDTVCCLETPNLDGSCPMCLDPFPALKKARFKGVRDAGMPENLKRLVKRGRKLGWSVAYKNSCWTFRNGETSFRVRNPGKVTIKWWADTLYQLRKEGFPVD